MRAPSDLAVVLACSVAPMAYAVATARAALAYPHFAISDVVSAVRATAATGAATLVWLGLVAQAAWFARKRRPCAACFAAAALFPLFTLDEPVTQSAVARGVARAHVAHAAWACGGAATMATFVPPRRLAALGACVVERCVAGTLAHSAPLVLAGCAGEWLMVYGLTVAHAARGAL